MEYDGTWWNIIQEYIIYFCSVYWHYHILDMSPALSIFTNIVLFLLYMCAYCMNMVCHCTYLLIHILRIRCFIYTLSFSIWIVWKYRFDLYVYIHKTKTGVCHQVPIHHLTKVICNMLHICGVVMMNLPMRTRKLPSYIYIYIFFRCIKMVGFGLYTDLSACVFVWDVVFFGWLSFSVSVWSVCLCFSLVSFFM